ncbi:MAG: PAS domain S-box protein [Anaerolineae bacterium]|nr:PAS domain S-box protein [Anaerolineae bacterium]
MDDSLAVLVIEDSEDDAFLIARQLRRAGYDLTVHRVETAEDMEAALDSREWDVIIADHSMPRFSGTRALKMIQDRGLDLPFIVVSGTIGEEAAVAVMKAGAHDYVMKNNLIRLGPAVRRELQESRERQARRRAEERLRQSEARFRKMAQNIQDGLAIIEYGKVVYVNDRVCEIFGYPRDEVMQLAGLGMAVPEERERLRAIAELARTKGQMPSELEFWIERQDGTRRCIQNRYSMSIEDGKIVGRYVVTTDITERKLAEREVEERRTYLERVLRAAPDAIVSLDPQHRIVEWNAGAERLFGYTRQEVIGRDLDDLINSRATVEQARKLTAVLLGGQDVPPMEAVRYRKDGVPVDVIIAGSPIVVDGRLIGIVVLYTDISERKRAERLLQTLNEAALAVEQALTVEAIFDALGSEFAKLGFYCAVLLLHRPEQELRLAYFSHEAAAAAMVDDLVESGPEATRFPVDVVSVFRDVLCERRSIYMELLDVLREARPVTLGEMDEEHLADYAARRLIAAPLIVEDQAIGILAVYANDLVEEDVPAITAFAHQMAAAWRKAHLLRDLAESLDQLKRTQAQFLQAQKMEAIGRLAGGVAHDFNNALTIIRLSVQLLQRQLHVEDPLLEFVGQIDEAAERAARLTGQLLAFGRREIVEPQIVDVNQLVVNMIQMLRRLIGEDVDLVTTLEENLWHVEIDPIQLDQVIVNLAVNARDAMLSGGRLDIETANIVLDEGYAGSHVDVEVGEYVLLAISDTGIGMSPEVQSHLFEPFFTTKERGKGTGLGLATVYGIVKRYGGHIGVYSEVDRGSTFKIYLPRVVGEVRDDRADVETIQAAGGTETVLVVEDDIAVRDMACEILRAYGYQVLTASSGPAALDLAGAYDAPIHLLLTDVVLPQMNGRELSERLQGRRPDMQVIYMSGYGSSVIAQRGVGSEIAYLLSKPFTVETLTRKVRAALDGKGR